MASLILRFIMNTRLLNDQALVDEIQHSKPLHQSIVDEYYRRCIPLYLDFIGIHWHTGFYLDDGQPASPNDQTRMIRVTTDSINLSAQDHVLDVGCGIGSTACFLAQEYGCTVTGLTPVEDQLNIAQTFIERAKLVEKVHVDLGHASALPYPDNHFDALTFFESPCHFPDRKQFFNEAFRVLEPGGRIAGEDWLLTPASTSQQQRQPLSQAICQQWAIPSLDTGQAYQSFMENAGFIQAEYSDMRTEMYIQKGFSVTLAQQAELQADINSCENPLLKLTLQGLLTLGKAIDANVFTIGRFTALKPKND